MAEPHFETVLVERIGRVARITLNRPERRNAISNLLQCELIEAVEGCGSLRTSGDDPGRLHLGQAGDLAQSADYEYRYIFKADGEGRDGTSVGFATGEAG